MVRSAKASRKKRTPRPTAAPVIDSAPPAVVEHPDGDGWQAPDGDQKFVPSESHEVALAERDAVGDEALAPGEALQEALHEIGTTVISGVPAAMRWPICTLRRATTPSSGAGRSARRRAR